MKFLGKPFRISAITIFILAFALQAMAVAPMPEAVEKWKAEGKWEKVVNDWKEFKKRGGCAPEAHSVFDKKKSLAAMALGEQFTDTVRVIVILVDFSDWPDTGQSQAGTPADFDSILFSDRNIDSIYNPTGSMTDYYMEVSYGQFYIKGDIVGWYRMPKTYAYYVGDDNGLSRGAELATDAVDAAHNAGVDFSVYDHDGDSNCDGVIIIHAGPGAEEGKYGIWSHKSTLSVPRVYNDVTISSYTMNPEEFQNNLTPIGVFCHEYGHFLGLPDLYDVDYEPASSDGLGYWSLMASGNYLGGSKKPAHFDAWCKGYIGFLNIIELSENRYQQAIPAVEFNNVAYKLKNDSSGSQYWLVENRQKIGFDQSLPGAGLCIYHVDPGAGWNNWNYLRYHVALEQADGNNDLALTQYNRGDGGDPWPGTANARDFHNFTNPDTKTNPTTPVDTADVTWIGVWDISNSDSIMTADFDVVECSRPWVKLYGTDSVRFVDDPPGGDGDGIIEAGETIQFFFKIRNYMRNSYNIRASLATSSPAITFTTNDVELHQHLFGLVQSNLLAPIEFHVADTLTPSIDSFFLTITTDSLETPYGTGEYTTTFGFEYQIGGAQILIVDDDRGETYEESIENVFRKMKVPADTWHKQAYGTPTGAQLSKYRIVIWYTGDSTFRALDSTDVQAMKEFMDGGGNMLLSTLSGVLDLAAIDSVFLADYFGVRHTGNVWWIRFGGVTGNPFSEGLTFSYDGLNYPFRHVMSVAPVGIGEPAFRCDGNYEDSLCGISYTGSHKAIFLTFPMEFIDDNVIPWYPKDSLLVHALDFFGGNATSVYDGKPFTQLPKNFELEQNYPNPFNPTTNITYTLRSTSGFGRTPAKTNLSIYNVLGQHIKTLVDEIQMPGTYTVTWDGTDRWGREVASGVYFYRLVRGEDSEAKKMVLLK